MPEDIFIGALHERTGVLGELFLMGQFDLRRFKDVWHGEVVEPSVLCPPFQAPVSASLVEVMEQARERAGQYNQVFINEGHMIEALLEVASVSTLLRCSTSRITKNDVLQLVCSPRDLAVHLEGCMLDTSPAIGVARIRRATSNDRNAVLSYIQSEFGAKWMQTVRAAFQEKIIPLLLALDQTDIVGFACYDVVNQKKGLLGPMGTSLHSRLGGIGRTLLHHCLAEMKALGYEYAIIKDAGPIEFYERSCGAVLIPQMYP